MFSAATLVFSLYEEYGICEKCIKLCEKIGLFATFSQILTSNLHNERPNTEKMKKLLSIVTLMILATLWSECSSLSSQERYHGKVITEDGDSIPYANVVLLNATDSSYFTGMMSGELGEFDFTFPTKGILKVSHIGYLDAYVKSNSTEEIVVVMREDTTMLSELVVKANVPITRIDGDALVTNVKGTILEKMGTANEVLERLPGVVDNDGTIEVVGKGVPAIYINGRLVRNTHELQQIGAEKIAKVEVVTNPGARYDATVNSVIRITVEKEAGDGFAFDSNTRMTYRDFIYGSEIVNLNYRKNSWDLFGMLEYSDSKREWETVDIQKAWLASYYMLNSRQESFSHSKLLNGQVGFAFTPSDKHSFGMYYKTNNSSTRLTPQFSTEVWFDDVLEESYIAENKVDMLTAEHLVDGYYSGVFGEWSLDITSDIMWTSSTDEQMTREISATSNDRTITVDDGADARLLAGKINASRPLWKGNLNFGTEYTNSRREDHFYNAEEIMESSSTLIEENNVALYVETMQRLGKLTFRFGARYEHINSGYLKNGEWGEEQSRTYDKIFPAAMCMLPMGESMLQLSYAKKYDRPLYSQLSSTVLYINRYMYEGGNPLLRPQFRDIVSFNYKYRWLILSGSYTHVKDQIVSSVIQYAEKNNTLLSTKENSRYSLDKLQLIASLTPHFDKYHPTLVGGMMSQFHTINYRDEKKMLNTPIWIARFNNMLELPHAYTINADLYLTSKGDAENIEASGSWQIDLGVNKEIGKHWNIRFSATDIFNTARIRSYTMYSEASEMFMERCANTRAVSCTVKYNFNTTPSKYKGTGAGQSEKQRL